MDTIADKKLEAYLLSTCPRCRQVKDALDEMGLAYDKVMVDLLTGDERTQVIEKLRKHGKVLSFPVIIYGETALVGASVREVQEAFGENK